MNRRDTELRIQALKRARRQAAKRNDQNEYDNLSQRIEALKEGQLQCQRAPAA